MSDRCRTDPDCYWRAQYDALFEAQVEEIKLRQHAEAARARAEERAEEAEAKVKEWERVYLDRVMETAKMARAYVDRAEAREVALREAARAVVAEYRTDLRAGRWSDALLAAMDGLRAALAGEGER